MNVKELASSTFHRYFRIGAIPQVVLFTAVLALVYLNSQLVIATPVAGNTQSLAQRSPLDQKSSELDALEASNADLVNTLEYMVWPRQREQLLAELYINLKHQSNLKPLDARLWLQILSVQAEHEVSHVDRVWALELAIRLNRWNEKRRPILAYHCLVSEHLLANKGLLNKRSELGLLEQCLRLYAQLPSQDRPAHLSRIVGVSQSTLVAALARANNRKKSKRASRPQ